MGKLYERDDIYDLLESPKRDAITRKHYETVFSGKSIRTLLDVSIGTGSMTLPIADLGIAISGSDLSQNMLDRCRKKCEARNIPANLVADSRTCCLHPASATHRQMTDEQLDAAGVGADLIRLSCGLENTQDLIADIAQALENV